MEYKPAGMVSLLFASLDALTGSFVMSSLGCQQRCSVYHPAQPYTEGRVCMVH